MARQSDDPDEVYEDEFQGYTIGTITSIFQYDRPLRGAARRKKRPIGFMRDLNKLEYCDD